MKETITSKYSSQRSSNKIPGLPLGMKTTVAPKQSMIILIDFNGGLGYLE
jgi:hypothetical protein